MGRVGMGGWLNFSSDHVEPIKADHGTQPPPPTSSTFFVLSLFPPRVLAFIHPLSAPPPSQPHTSGERAFSFSDLLSLPSLTLRALSSRTPGQSPTSRRRASSAFHLVFLLLPRPPSRSLARSLSGNSLDFFASRGGVIYLAEVERGTHGGGRRSARGGGGLGYGGLRGLPAAGGRGRAEKGIAGE